MNKKTLTLTVVGILLLIGIAVAAGIKPAAKAPATATATPTATVAAASPAAAAFVVNYMGDSFTPAETTVKSGQSITFTNRSQVSVQIDSDPHPVHTDDTDLNVGVVAPGESKTVTVTKKGTFGIHNHLNPAQSAKITIQ